MGDRKWKMEMERERDSDDKAVRRLNRRTKPGISDEMVRYPRGHTHRGSHMFELT